MKRFYKIQLDIEDTVEELDMFGLEVACDVIMHVIGEYDEIQVGDPVITCVHVGDEGETITEKNPLVMQWIRETLAVPVQEWFRTDNRRIEENARDALIETQEAAKEREY